MVFSTSKAIKALEQAGFETDKAIAIATIGEEVNKRKADIITADKLAVVFANFEASMAGLRSEVNSGFAELRSEMNERFAEMNAQFDEIDARFDGLAEKIESQPKLLLKSFENKALIYGVPIVMGSSFLGAHPETVITWLTKILIRH